MSGARGAGFAVGARSSAVVSAILPSGHSASLGALALSSALRRGGTVPSCARGAGARGSGFVGPCWLSSTASGVVLPCDARRVLCLVSSLPGKRCVDSSSKAGGNSGRCSCTRRFWPRATVKLVECVIRTVCALLFSLSGPVTTMHVWCPFEAVTMCSVSDVGPNARSSGFGATPAARGGGIAVVGPRDALVTSFLPRSSERKQEIGGADGFSAHSLVCGRRCDRGSEQQVCKLNF